MLCLPAQPGSSTKPSAHSLASPFAPLTPLSMPPPPPCPLPAAGLETELIRVAVELESSRLAKLAGRPAGGPGAAGVGAGRLRSEEDMEVGQGGRWLNAAGDWLGLRLREDPALLRHLLPFVLSSSPSLPLWLPCLLAPINLYQPLPPSLPSASPNLPFPASSLPQPSSPSLPPCSLS